MDREALLEKARKNNPEAQFELASFLLQDGGKENRLLAEKWLKKAAAKKHPGAACALGRMMLESGNVALAHSLFERAVKWGNTDACELLGNIYRGDFSPEFEDRKKAFSMYARYYKTVGKKALEPLLSVYRFEDFKDEAVAEEMLEAAYKDGYVKAQYHLALIKLKQRNKTKEAVTQLEDYYRATADVNAAKTLYQIYSPHDDTYPNTEKSAAQSKAYLAAVIDGGGTFEEADILAQEPIYLEPAIPSVKKIFDDNMRRMKTSVTIDEAFQQDVDEDVLNLTVRFDFVPRFDIDAHMDIDVIQHIKESVDVPVKKKHTVRKGFKKTGTVKIPETVQKEKKRSVRSKEEKKLERRDAENLKSSAIRVTSLKGLTDGLASKDAFMVFGSLPSKKTRAAMVEKHIAAMFKKPKRAKKIKMDHTYETAYLLQPAVLIDYTYGKRRYKETHPLKSHMASPMFSFPLNTHYERKRKKHARRRAAAQRNHWFTTLMFVLLLSWVLVNAYQLVFTPFATNTSFVEVGLVVAGAFVVSLAPAWFLHRMTAVKTISDKAFLLYHDEANVDAMKPIEKENTVKLAVKLAGLAVLAIALILMQWL